MPADTRYAWNNCCGEVLEYAPGFLSLLVMVAINTVGMIKMLPESIFWLLEVFFFLFECRMNYTLLIVGWDSPSDLALVGTDRLYQQSRPNWSEWF